MVCLLSCDAAYLVSFSTPHPTLCKKGKVTFLGGGESGEAKAAPSFTVLPRIRGCNILLAGLSDRDRELNLDVNLPP